jgi:hypothetical protein
MALRASRLHVAAIIHLFSVILMPEVMRYEKRRAPSNADVPFEGLAGGVEASRLFVLWARCGSVVFCREGFHEFTATRDIEPGNRDSWPFVPLARTQRLIAC